MIHRGGYDVIGLNNLVTLHFRLVIITLVSIFVEWLERPIDSSKFIENPFWEVNPRRREEDQEFHQDNDQMKCDRVHIHRNIRGKESGSTLVAVTKRGSDVQWIHNCCRVDSANGT